MSKDAYKILLEEMNNRIFLELKGQHVNSFETPQYIRAARDRIILYNIIKQLEKELEIMNAAWDCSK